MSFFDRLLGREPEGQPQAGYGQPMPGRGRPMTDDERAIERYRYLLKTAPPDQIEQAHAEAFAQLSPEQRQQVLESLAREAPEDARAASNDPQSLARFATRAEIRQPGTLERAWGGGGMAGGMPGFGTFFLASLAGTVVGSAIAQSFFADSGYDAGAEGADAGAEGDAAGSEQGGDAAEAGWGGDQGYEGAGTEYGQDAGGDLGGGDFGGGDFGGGDFGGDI